MSPFGKLTEDLMKPERTSALILSYFDALEGLPAEPAQPVQSS